MNRLLLAAALLALAGCGKGNAAGSQLHVIDRSHAGEAAPNVPFETRDGTKATVASFKGKRVLVNLWATWCVPCVAEMPELDRLAAAKGAALTVLPLSQDMEGWRAVDKFVAKAKLTALTIRVDQPGNFADAVKAKGLPVSILYDATGHEVWRVAGTLKWLSPEVQGAL